MRVGNKVANGNWEALGTNLRWGLSWMFLFMMVFAVVALIPFGLKGTSAGEGYFTLPQLLSTYLLIAVFGGFVLGLLRPVSRTMPGVALIGFLIGGIAAISFHFGRDGFGAWEDLDSFLLVLFAVTGVPFAMGMLWRLRRIEKNRGVPSRRA